MPLLRTTRFLAGRLKRFFIYRVLSLNDTPHRIALGVAVGIFITWTPSIPFQMVLTASISMLLGANKFVGVPFVWISNPFTLVPVYYPNYLLGRWILGGTGRGFWAFIDATNVTGGLWVRIRAFWSATLQVFWPLWVGSIIVGLALAVVTYFLMRWAVVAFRRRIHHHQEVVEARKGASGES